MKRLLMPLLLLSACAQAPVVIPSQSSSPSPQPSGTITLVQEFRDYPLADKDVRYSMYDSLASKTTEKQARTDAQGQFKEPCEGLCQISLNVPGYWPYSGPYSGPAQIQMAALTPEELSGRQIELGDYLLTSLITREGGYTQLFDTASNMSYFQVRSESELEAVLIKLKPSFEEDRLNHPAPVLADKADPEIVMRQAIKDGKRLIGFTTNQQFRYIPQIERLTQTDDSYYFSQNRTQLLSSRGISGHTYDYELLIYALPADGKKVVFHAVNGKLELQP